MMSFKEFSKACRTFLNQFSTCCCGNIKTNSSTMKLLEISIPLKTHHLRNFSAFKNNFLCFRCFWKVSQCILWVKSNQKYIWGRKSSWGPDFPENHAFWGFTTTYVSKCRNIPRCRRNMLDSAFESRCSILSDLKKKIFHKNSSRRALRFQMY